MTRIVKLEPLRQGFVKQLPPLLPFNAGKAALEEFGEIAG